jgi:hypothetical protein
MTVNQEELLHDQARKLLGRRVTVTLKLPDGGAEAVITTGVLLGFGEGGEFEVLEADGFVHYCWPMLTIEEKQ